MCMSEPTTPGWHLVQLNVARPLAPLASPQLTDFMNQLDAINALAEASPGFVWRLVGSGGNATDVIVADDPSLLVNMSVWTSVELLFDFVYKTAHTKVMARRREWFEKLELFQVLYWISEGQLPSVAEALARLEMLRAAGPSPEAFTFKQRFPAPGHRSAALDLRPELYCG